MVTMQGQTGTTSWSLPAPVKWVFKGAGAGLVMTGLVACSTVPNDSPFQPTGRILKDATVLRVEYDGHTMQEIGRSVMEVVRMPYSANSTPPVLGRCFYRIVVGLNARGTGVEEGFVERRCPNFVTGFTPAGPYNRY